MTQHYNKAGQPIQQHTWARYFEDVDYRRVDRTEVGDAAVSTIWQGHSLGAGTDDPPLIFETVILGVPTDDDAWSKWTPSLAKAKAMHRAAVAWLRGDGPEPGITERDLNEAEQRYRVAVAAAEQAREIRNQIVKDASVTGWSHARIAKATGLTRARVGQLALSQEAGS